MPNQYYKRDSFLLFGVHSLSAFVRGFTPVSPIHFIGHSSQTHNKLSLDHFGSKLLRLFCCRRIVKKESIEDLYSFFSALEVFITNCKSESPRNFKEFKTKCLPSNAFKYMILLIELAVLAEDKLEEVEGGCFLFRSFPTQNVKYDVFKTSSALKPFQRFQRLFKRL